jgi:hypothetical protein
LCFLYRFFVKRMLLTSKTIVQIQSKLEAIKACCVILSKETLIVSVRVMNRTELSYAQNKNRGEKMGRLGLDTYPRLSDIMEINKAQ